MCRLVEVIPSDDTTFVFFVPFIVLNNTKGEIVANGHCFLFYLSFSRVAGGWVGSDMSITCVGGRRYLIDIYDKLKVFTLALEIEQQLCWSCMTYGSNPRKSGLFKIFAMSNLF